MLRRSVECCGQAVYEVPQGAGQTKCWLGTGKMTEAPDGWSRPDSEDFCYAKAVAGVQPVTVTEEKFISSNDVVTTTIVADTPVTLRIEGRSFQVRGGDVGAKLSTKFHSIQRSNLLIYYRCLNRSQV